MLQALVRKLLHPVQQAIKQERADAQSVAALLGLPSDDENKP